MLYCHFGYDFTDFPYQKKWSEGQCRNEVIPFFNRFSQLQVYVGNPEAIGWIQDGIQDPTRVEAKVLHTFDSVMEWKQGDDWDHPYTTAEGFLHYFNTLIEEPQSFSTDGLEVLVELMEPSFCYEWKYFNDLYSKSHQEETDPYYDNLRIRISEGFLKQWLHCLFTF